MLRLDPGTSVPRPSWCYPCSRSVLLPPTLSSSLRRVPTENLARVHISPGISAATLPQSFLELLCERVVIDRVDGQIPLQHRAVQAFSRARAMDRPRAIGISANDFYFLPIVGDMNDLTKSGNALVMLEFFSAIVFLGARAQNLDEQCWIGYRQWILGITLHGPAHDTRIRIRVKSGRSHADPHVGRLRAARSTRQRCGENPNHIRSIRSVFRGPPGHREDLSHDELVAYVGVFLEAHVFFDCVLAVRRCRHAQSLSHAVDADWCGRRRPASRRARPRVPLLPGKMADWDTRNRLAARAKRPHASRVPALGAHHCTRRASTNRSRRFADLEHRQVRSTGMIADDELEPHARAYPAPAPAARRTKAAPDTEHAVRLRPGSAPKGRSLESQLPSALCLAKRVGGAQSALRLGDTHHAVTGSEITLASSTATWGC